MISPGLSFLSTNHQKRKPRRRIKHLQQARIRCLIVHYLGRTILTPTDENDYIVWEHPFDKPARRLKRGGWPWSCLLTPDGKLAIGTTPNGELFVWDTRTGHALAATGERRLPPGVVAEALVAEIRREHRRQRERGSREAPPRPRRLRPVAHPGGAAHLQRGELGGLRSRARRRRRFICFSSSKAKYGA